jgi:hypothetical protein
MTQAAAIIPAVIIAIGLAVAGGRLAEGIERFRMEDRVITVKGLAEQDVESDFATWNIVFRRAANSFGEVQRSLATDPLIKQGVAMMGGTGPWYQLRAFNEAKAPLLAAATRNARQQADQFAKEAGAKIGRLRSANQGVISITAASSQFGDDMSARTKLLRVVSTFQYELE